jgi:hypothetical protein
VNQRVPPRSRWAIVLYVAATLLAISGVTQGFTRSYADDEFPGLLGIAFQFNDFVGGLVPALVFGVLGGAVQYLADIRWALIQRLDDPNA